MQLIEREARAIERRLRAARTDAQRAAGLAALDAWNKRRSLEARMDAASRVVEQNPRASIGDVVGNVAGRQRVVVAALRALFDEGYIAALPGARMRVMRVFRAPAFEWDL